MSLFLVSNYYTPITTNPPSVIPNGSIVYVGEDSKLYNRSFTYRAPDAGPEVWNHALSSYYKRFQEYMAETPGTYQYLWKSSTTKRQGVKCADTNFSKSDVDSKELGKARTYYRLDDVWFPQHIANIHVPCMIQYVHNVKMPDWFFESSSLSSWFKTTYRKGTVWLFRFDMGQHYFDLAIYNYFDHDTDRFIYRSIKNMWSVNNYWPQNDER